MSARSRSRRSPGWRRRGLRPDRARLQPRHRPDAGDRVRARRHRDRRGVRRRARRDRHHARGRPARRRVRSRWRSSRSSRGGLSVAVYVLAVRPFARAGATCSAGSPAARRRAARARTARARVHAAGLRAPGPARLARRAGARRRHDRPCARSRCWRSASPPACSSSARWRSPAPARSCARGERGPEAAALLGVPIERVVLALSRSPARWPGWPAC